MKGRVEMCLGSNFSGKLGGLYNSVIEGGRDGSMVRVIARGLRWDLEGRR